MLRGAAEQQVVTTVLLGLAGSYMAGKEFHANRAEATAVDLDAAVEQLAVAVKSNAQDPWISPWEGRGGRTYPNDPVMVTG